MTTQQAENRVTQALAKEMARDQTLTPEARARAEIITAGVQSLFNQLAYHQREVKRLKSRAPIDTETGDEA